MGIPKATCWAVAVLAAATAAGQTRIDLRTQGRRADLGAMGPTRPFQTGTTLPASCTVGEGYFKTDAPAGENVYVCTEQGAWAPLGASKQPNYAGTFTGQTEVWIPAAIHGLGSANLMVDCYDDAAPARRVEPDSVTVDPETRDVRVTFAVPQNGRCVINGSGGSTDGAVTAEVEVTAGTGLVAAHAGRTTTVQVDTAVVPTFLTGSAAVTFGAIAPGSCAEGTVPLTGAATGDAVSAGWPAALPAGLAGSMRVSAAATVTVRLCNTGASTVAGWTDIFRAAITRSF